jgi:hypothetical protein
MASQAGLAGRSILAELTLLKLIRALRKSGLAGPPLME